MKLLDKLKYYKSYVFKNKDKNIKFTLEKRIFRYITFYIIDKNNKQFSFSSHEKFEKYLSENKCLLEFHFLLEQKILEDL